MEEKLDYIENTKEQSKKIIEQILEEGINTSNINFFGELIDIIKDLENIEYWKEKLYMKYRNYSEYGDESYGRRSRDSRGRYRDGGSYGRRGVPGSGRGRYRGEEILDDMMEKYQNYSESSENYGADDETMKSFKYMLKSFKDYFKHLKTEASSQEEVQMLEDVAHEICEM